MKSYLAPAIFFAYSLLSASCSDKALEEKELKESNAIAFVHRQISTSLRSPSTVVFDDGKKPLVLGERGDTLTIMGHLDAENGFGARTRENYSFDILSERNTHFVVAASIGSTNIVRDIEEFNRLPEMSIEVRELFDSIEHANGSLTDAQLDKQYAMQEEILSLMKDRDAPMSSIFKNAHLSLKTLPKDHTH